jgi:hypothetical protein
LTVTEPRSPSGINAMISFTGSKGRGDNLLYNTTERQKYIDEENGRGNMARSKNHKKKFMDYDFMKDFVHFKHNLCQR